MIDPETTAFIQREVRKQLNVILSGTSGANESVVSEDIGDLYPGMPVITQRPVMHPYGFASRAPAGTIQVTARQGDHPGNRAVLGHRAADRPTDIEEGESVLYSKAGYEVRVLNGKLQVGKDGDFETVVVGETLQTLLTMLITEISTHTHLFLGLPTTPPVDAAAFMAFITAFLANKKILATDGGRY